MRADRGDGISVHAEYACAGEKLIKLLDNRLSTRADKIEYAAAFGTGVIGAAGIAAIVTHEPSVQAVISK